MSQISHATSHSWWESGSPSAKDREPAVPSLGSGGAVVDLMLQ